MRPQAKSIDAFAANPIRARILAREIERKILEVDPPGAGRYCRLHHVTRWIELNEDPTAYKGRDADEVAPSLRRPFSRWLGGTALPSSGTRMRIDGLFDEPLGSAWVERKLDSPEQTLLVALDLISKSSPPNRREVLLEADEVLTVVGSSFSKYIPGMIALDGAGHPRITSYSGIALHDEKKQKRSRKFRYSNKRLIAYPYIKERISPYNPISPLCAGLLYLVKPNNTFSHGDEIAFKMLCDFISGSIAAYLVMLHRNPAEFKGGGLVVNLYRLAFTFFLWPEGCNSKKEHVLLHEIFRNEFPEFKGENGELDNVFARLVALFQSFGDKAGLSNEEVIALMVPANPNNPKEVRSWWRDEL